MSTKLIENFFTCLGYFDIQTKIPFRTLLFTIGKLYSLFFVIYFNPDLEQQRIQKQESKFEVLIPFQIQLMTQILNNVFFLKSILLIFNIIMILAICFIITNHYFSKEQENIDESVKQNNFYNMFLQIIAIMCTIFNCAFIQPLLILGLYCIKDSTNHQEYFWVVNSIFFSSFLHIWTYLHFSVTQGAIVIVQNEQKKLSLQFFEYVQFILLHIQPYILIYSNKKDAIYIQSTIYLLITILEGFQIFLSWVYSNKKQILISITIHSFGIYIIIANFIKANQTIVLVILLALLQTQITKNLYEEFILSIYLKDLDLLNLNEIHYLICLIVAQEKLERQKICIINAIKLYQHQLICIQPSCICRKQFSNSSNSQQFLILADIFENEIRNELTWRMRKFILNLQFENYFYYCCHYYHAQNLFGKVQEVFGIIENQQIVEKLSKIQLIKWKIFIIIIKQSLFNNFTAKIENYSRDQTALSLKINQFVQSESFNQNIKEGMINIIQQKIDYQQKILSQTQQKNSLTEYYDLIINIEKQEKKLQMIYDKFPSQKNQSQLMFFFSEIKCDWQKAYDKLEINAIDNQLLTNNYDIDINQLTNKMAYLTFSFENRNLKIQSFSKKAPQIFGYDQNLFELIQQANNLIPKSIRDQHTYLVERFLIEGKGHFFRKQSPNICLQKNGLLQNIDFFYDLYFDNNQCFRFIGFFCVNEEIEPLILIDLNNEIQGLNKEFFKKMNFNPHFLDTVELEEQFYSLPAQLFIPNNILNGETNAQTFQFSFPKEQIFSQILKQNNLIIKQQYLKKEKNLLTFDVNFEITIRENYKIMKFKKIQETYQIKKFLSLEAVSYIEQPIQINQEESVIHPYDENRSSPEIPFTINIVLDTSRRMDQNLKKLNDGEQIQMSRFSQHQILYDYSQSNLSNLEEKTIQILGNIYKDGIRNNQENFDGSQASSIVGLRKSKFFRKYSLLNQLNEAKTESPVVLKIFVALFLALTAQTIYLLFVIEFFIFRTLFIQNKILMIQITIMNPCKQIIILQNQCRNFSLHDICSKIIK